MVIAGEKVKQRLEYGTTGKTLIFATTTYVDEAIGDIETILDTLING